MEMLGSQIVERKKKRMNKSAKEVMENYKIILSFLEQSKVILEIMTVIF